jgi:hypothetical protein
MSLIPRRLQKVAATPDEEQVEQLRHPATPGYTVEVQPPKNKDIPATLPRFTQGITEIQTKWLKTQNVSPTIAFEIRRAVPDKVQFQYTLPTKRLERKLRTHLSTEIPGVKFQPGTNGLPVTTEDTVGGGFLTTGRMDCFPLHTQFQEPPINSVAASLHRHAMQDTKIIIQILFQPVAGKPLQRWYWKRRAYQRRNYLKKEKEKLWGSRSPTKREKKQSQKVEAKAGSNRYHTTIRFAIIGADEYTPSRIKELAGGFNVYEDLETGQYLDIVTISPLFEDRIIDFCRAVADRRFQGWSQSFQTSVQELAALVSLPNQTQQNIENAQP